MSNGSFAAQAVANGPMTAAPPSFDGHGWLVVLNLSLMMATAFLALGLALSIAATPNCCVELRKRGGPSAALVKRQR